MDTPRLVLYTKPGCHLCEDMRDQLRAAIRGTRVELVERNIAANLDDYARYKHDIPVLVIDGREVARHRVATEDLHDALAVAGLLARVTP